MAGLFSTIGAALNTVSTTVVAVDKTVTRSSNLIDDTFDLADMAMADVKADMETDRIVSDAKRDARIAVAQAEADAIRASIGQQPVTPP
jgi:regulator of protease activity HflC (stomatin/prohibitin superfamily)